jgi:hypothetical protein
VPPTQAFMLLMEAIEKVAAQAFMQVGERKPRLQAEAHS